MKRSSLLVLSGLALIGFVGCEPEAPKSAPSGEAPAAEAPADAAPKAE